MTEHAAAEARALIAQNDYLTLATAGADGAPWASPVWFAARGLELFVWASKPGARHSRNIAENPRVSFAIFDSMCVLGEGRAVYVAADARLVEPAGFAEALAVYNAASRARGLPAWSADQLTAPARHRLYAAVAREVFVLDDHDERVAVPLDGAA